MLGTANAMSAAPISQSFDPMSARKRGNSAS